MSKFLFHMTRAVSAGRSLRSRPGSREEVLRALLSMRAAAARSGLDDLESQLRSQIRWALPVRYPRDEDGIEISAEPDEPPHAGPRPELPE
jgi:hypothetical protein